MAIETLSYSCALFFAVHSQIEDAESGADI